MIESDGKKVIRCCRQKMICKLVEDRTSEREKERKLESEA